MDVRTYVRIWVLDVRTYLGVGCTHLHMVGVTKNLTFRNVITSLRNVFTEFCNVNTNHVEGEFFRYNEL